MTVIASCEAAYDGNEETTAYFNFLQNGLAVNWNPIVYIMSITNHLSYIVDQNLSKITVGWALSRSLTLQTPAMQQWRQQDSVMCWRQQTVLPTDDTFRETRRLVWREWNLPPTNNLMVHQQETMLALERGGRLCDTTHTKYNVELYSYILSLQKWIRPQETSQARKNLERCMMYHCSTALVPRTVGTISER